MWKNILLLLLKWSLGRLYDFVDKDNNGEISREEIESIVVLIRDYASKLKKKAK